MKRSIPPHLAPVLEQLELQRPNVVTTEAIGQIVNAVGTATPPRVVIQRLAARGWLLRTGVHGVWEFAPAERAGAYSTADPYLVLRAALLAMPDLPAAAALGSAMWLHDLADRGPDVAEVALPRGQHVPVALRRTYRVLHHASRLNPVRIRGLPVHRPATVLVHLAERPTDVRSWSSVLERLSDLVAAAPEEEIVAELAGRSHATKVRLAYLLSGVAPDLVERLRLEAAGKVWFGPRDRPSRYDTRWNVADTILPYAPTELGAAR